mmetsp:Transcript_1214/g.2755  ORF Transcript_1214/g.2755 Transcript_1214/m.2755 type:complete len:95 (+) Transcript_1214:1833-2117(+)
MIKTAKHVPTTYITPSHYDIGGSLLCVNYNDYMRSTTEKLMIDANLYGLCAYGDGATLMRCPLANILFSGLFNVLLYHSLFIFCSDNFNYYYKK